MKEKWSIKIQQARKALGLTQKELGEAIGVAERTIIKFENSTGFPSYYTLIQLCNYLNLNAYDIIELCDHPEYYEKAFYEVSQIINKSDYFSISPEFITSWSYKKDKLKINCSTNKDKCTIHFHDDANEIPDLEINPDIKIEFSKEKLLQKSYEIKQQLKEEYEKRLLEYIESLFWKTHKKKSD